MVKKRDFICAIMDAPSIGFAPLQFIDWWVLNWLAMFSMIIQVILYNLSLILKFYKRFINGNMGRVIYQKISQASQINFEAWGFL